MVKVLSRKVLRKDNVTLNRTTFEGLLLIKLALYTLLFNSLLHYRFISKIIAIFIGYIFMLKEILSGNVI